MTSVQFLQGAIVVASVAALCAAAAVNLGEISTIGGTGTDGYSGDGGAATSAQLDTPEGVAVADNGDVYIADSVNMVIRKVDYATGDISTVAGGLLTPSVGDGKAATAAALDTPSAIVVDSSSNLFIADTNHHRIRKVTNATGLMSTIGGTGTKGYSGDGGPATDAMISGPDGIAVDSSGNVIFTDTDNNRIRKITTGGTITTIAGTGAKGYSGDGGAATAAKLQKPEGIAIDGSDNIFFADTSNNVIRKFTDGGNISTVAGTGAKGYSGDGGVATSATLEKPTAVWVNGSDVYVADTGNDVVRMFTDGGNISTVAGTGAGGFNGDGGAATSAKLKAPGGVAMDSGGELYIADTDNRRIRMVDSVTGNISTYGGTGNAGYSGDGGPATSADINEPLRLFVDGSDDLFLADSANHVIRKIASATGNISLVAGIPGQTFASDDGELATNAYLNEVEGVAIDSNGNLFIACTLLGTVRRVDGGTSIITTVMGTGTAYTPAVPTDDVLLINPAGVAVDNDDNVYVVDRSKNNNRVIKLKISDTTYFIVAGTGAQGYTGDGGPATSATLGKATGVAVDKDGNVYIADTNNHVVRKVDLGTAIITTFAGTGAGGYSGDGGLATAAKFDKPGDVAVDVWGNVYIADTENFVVRKVDGATLIVTTFAGTGTEGYSGDGGPAVSAELTNTLSLAVDSSRNVYIGGRSKNFGSVVRKVDGAFVRITSWREVEPQ